MDYQITHQNGTRAAIVESVTIVLPESLMMMPKPELKTKKPVMKRDTEDLNHKTLKKRN